MSKRLIVLTGALTGLAARVPPRGTGGIARLPIDRAFTMKGFGTVITGTLVSGRLGVDDDVVLLPSARRAKVRGIQVHGRAAPPAAANTVGADLQRWTIAVDADGEPAARRDHRAVRDGEQPRPAAARGLLLRIAATVRHEPDHRDGQPRPEPACDRNERIERRAARRDMPVERIRDEAPLRDPPAVHGADAGRDLLERSGLHAADVGDHGRGAGQCVDDPVRDRGGRVAAGAEADVIGGLSASGLTGSGRLPRKVFMSPSRRRRRASDPRACAGKGGWPSPRRLRC